jgi:hypothetical protein
MPDTEQEQFNRKSHMGEQSTPRPDPTALTTEQLIREISRLEESVRLRSAESRAQLEGQIDLTNERFEALRRSLDERFATQQFAISTAFDAAQNAKEGAKELFDAKLSSLTDMLNERYATQTKALDAAFLAQQAAVATSFDASEKAMAAALLAAKEAVEKANTATEKRFDGVNEQLAQQTGVLSELLPRAEAEARITDLDRRLTDIKSTVDKGFTGVDVRHSEGSEYRVETRDRTADSRANIAIAISVGVGVLTIIVMIILGLHTSTGH